MRRVALGLSLCFTVVVSFAPSASAIEEQETDSWCWASAIQEILASRGIHRSQAEIAAALDAGPEDGADTEEVSWLLEHYGLDNEVVERAGTPEELQEALSEGYGVIALGFPEDGDWGHFVVLSASDGRSVVVSDPATGETTTESLAELYSDWNWSESVVIDPTVRKLN